MNCSNCISFDKMEEITVQSEIVNSYSILLCVMFSLKVLLTGSLVKNIFSILMKKKQFVFNVHKKGFSNNVFIETMFDG